MSRAARTLMKLDVAQSEQFAHLSCAVPLISKVHPLTILHISPTPSLSISQPLQRTLLVDYQPTSNSRPTHIPSHIPPCLRRASKAFPNCFTLLRHTALHLIDSKPPRLTAASACLASSLAHSVAIHCQFRPIADPGSPVSAQPLAPGQLADNCIYASKFSSYFMLAISTLSAINHRYHKADR